MRIRKIMKTSKNHKEKTSVFVDIHISKIMLTPIKAGM